ncbi:MAG: hypothetical protein IJX12_06220, partial [Lachnospiraceae bacterium]|nr:hypothetical protein [Lachnospiraceae bacterium]
MKLLYKLENKFGKYALRNLSGIIIACFGISYLLWMFFPSIYELFVFDYFYVFAGHQYWRIFTWIFTMPGGIDVFTILMLFIYYSIGNSVERAVGTFLYNVYIFGALIMLTIAQVVAGLYEYLQMPEFYDTMYETMKSSGLSMYNQD